MKDGPTTMPVISVWDRAVRLLHWTLVVSVALATLGVFTLFGLHQPAGYVALAVVVLRALWGCFGSPYARFRQFMRTPDATWRYLQEVVEHREPRYIGHNPLGGLMVIALMVCVSGLALTGWLYTTDAYWGDETVEAVHRWLAWALLGLVITHLAGVVFTSLRHRENLVAAMVRGVKRAPTKSDIA